MTDALDYVIYGRPLHDGEPSADLDILAFSGTLTPHDVVLWRNLVSIDPPPDTEDTQAVGIFAGPGEDYLLARAYRRDIDWPVYQYVWVPREVMGQMAGDLKPLLALVSDPVPEYETRHNPVPGLKLPRPPTWTVDKRAALFSRLLTNGSDFMTLLALLAAALDERHVVIRHFPTNFDRRIAFVQGLMMLLPAAARADLTFSTYVSDVQAASARLVFSEDERNTLRWIFDWQTGWFSGDESGLAGLLQMPYTARLSELWQGEPLDFMIALKAMDFTAARLMPGKTLVEGLNEVARRDVLDIQVRQAESVIDPEALKAALTGSAPPEGELLYHYLEHLLVHALRERDTDAARIVARYMDAYPPLDEALNEILNAEIEAQPDAVYVFIRARLSEGVEKRWLPRLRAAAVRSLEVAIKDADTRTLSGWLKLISREPAAYELSDLLHDGLLAAQPRAHVDSDLALQLIVLAVKRDPDSLDQLLSDAELREALPDPLQSALCAYDPASILTLYSQGRELFLMTLSRAARARAGEAFTPEVIVLVWNLYTDEQVINLPLHYRPESIIGEWVEHGVDWMSIDALETLLMLVLSSRHDGLFYQLVHHMSSHEALFPLLATVLQRSGRSVSDILGIIGQVVAVGDMTQQQAVNTYIALLAGWDWKKDSQPLAEQLARMIQQYPNLKIAPEVNWRMLDVAAESKLEIVARAATRRLLTSFEVVEDQTELVKVLLRLVNQIQWSAALRQQVINWWREFARTQPLANLQRLDKALEGKRPLEELRLIVQTSMAIRKMFGKRSLEGFAQDISTAYRTLQTLADSFEPTAKQSISFDQATVRAELELKEDSLSPQERKLLAKNLKELAQIITALSENRSKASLIRRDDELDRQLMSGEQQPQSAIDAMKWMSGYLDGAQNKDEEHSE